MSATGSIVLLMVVLGAAPGTKRSQESKRHMKAATSAFQLSDYPHAIEEFKKAYEAKPDVRILYNLGLTYMKLYELGAVREDQVQAKDYFKRFLALVSTQEWSSDKEKAQVDKMRALADQYLAQLNAEPEKPPLVQEAKSEPEPGGPKDEPKIAEVAPVERPPSEPANSTVVMQR